MESSVVSNTNLAFRVLHKCRHDTFTLVLRRCTYYLHMITAALHAHTDSVFHQNIVVTEELLIVN